MSEAAAGTIPRRRDLRGYRGAPRDGATAPKMLSIGLHLRMIGRPGRIGALDMLLAKMRARGGVWFARRADIARHWIARIGNGDVSSTTSIHLGGE